MSNRILLIMPKFNNYEKILELQACKKFSIVDVVFYDEIDFFSLKKMPFFIKLILFITKAITNKNHHESVFFIKLRDFFLSIYSFPKFNKWVRSKVNSKFKYDNLIVIKGYGLYQTTIDSIASNYKAFYQWDNVIHFPSTLKIVSCFDVVYSFDKKDSEKMGWHYLPNFYLPRVSKIKNNDVFFVGVYSQLRYKILTEIINICHLRGYSYFIKLYSPNLQEDNLITNTKLPKEKYNEVFERSKFIIEITKQEQDGYSQRYLEALNNKSLFIIANSSYSMPCGGRVLSLDEFMSKSKMEIDFLLESEYLDSEKELLAICSVSNWLGILCGDYNSVYFNK